MQAPSGQVRSQRQCKTPSHSSTGERVSVLLHQALGPLSNPFETAQSQPYFPWSNASQPGALCYPGSPTRRKGLVADLLCSIPHAHSTALTSVHRAHLNACTAAIEHPLPAQYLLGCCSGLWGTSGQPQSSAPAVLAAWCLSGSLPEQGSYNPSPDDPGRAGQSWPPCEASAASTPGDSYLETLCRVCLAEASQVVSGNTATALS